MSTDAALITELGMLINFDGDKSTLDKSPDLSPIICTKCSRFIGTSKTDKMSVLRKGWIIKNSLWVCPKCYK